MRASPAWHIGPFVTAISILVHIDIHRYVHYGGHCRSRTRQHMDLRMELLASAHSADVARMAAERQRRSLLSTCRRWILGFIPVRQTACTQCAGA